MTDTTIEIKTTTKIDVKYLRADCNVRYWEDAKVNGVEDENGTLIPCRDVDSWKPLIDLETGKILNWEEGKEARIHYKVCDAGAYYLLDDRKNIICEKYGYVPKILCPEDNGFGDYVIMNVDKDGMIQNWKVDLDYFKEPSND